MRLLMYPSDSILINNLNCINLKEYKRSSIFKYRFVFLNITPTEFQKDWKELVQLFIPKLRNNYMKRIVKIYQSF